MQTPKIGFTMFLFIMQKVIMSLLIVGIAFFAIILFIDTMSLASRMPHLSTRQIMIMEILNFPILILSSAPYILMFAFMHAFFYMNKEKNTTIQYGVGLSPIQILSAPILIAFVLGILYTTMLTPITSLAYERYKKYWNAYENIANGTEITVNENTLWLREKIPTGYRIIRSTYTTGIPITLYKVHILEMDAKQNIQQVLKVDKMTLHPTKFILNQGTITNKNNITTPIQNMEMPTMVNNSLIENIIVKPEEMSFWELPKHIQSLNQGGLNTKHHIFTYHKLLSIPFMFIGLVLFASYFTIRPYTRIVPSRLIGMGIITSFVVFFFLYLTQSLVFLTPLPAFVLGWLPTIIIMLIGGFLILSSEKVG